MFAGHIGAALAIGRFEKRVNVGVFVAAAVLLDALLWVLVLMGWESVFIPADYAMTHQPQYSFPISHGLVESLCWSLLIGVIAWFALARVATARRRAAALIGAAVFSHWLLDALVHRPELPLAGANSATVGLGLWEYLPVALAVEAAITALGLWLYLPRSGFTRRKSMALVALVALVLVFTVVGMTVAAAPPSVNIMAISSLATLVVVCALTTWIGRVRN